MFVGLIVPQNSFWFQASVAHRLPSLLVRKASKRELEEEEGKPIKKDDVDDDSDNEGGDEESKAREDALEDLVRSVRYKLETLGNA